MTIYLFDMDDVIVEFTEGFWEKVKINHPSVIIPELHTSDSFNLTHNVANLSIADARAIIDEAGFFATLKASEGAIQTLQALQAAGHTIFICTAPAPANPTCVEDKLEWVRKNLGEDWVERTIITLDKTTVQGDYLFDDKPNILGEGTPTWEHVLWNRPCNYSERSKRRIHSWAEVASFIANLSQQKVVNV